MSGLLLSINPYIGKIDDNGDVAGFYGPFNNTALALTRPDPEQIIRESYLRDTPGEALDTYSRKKPVEIEFTTDNMAPDIISMAMQGTPANYTQTLASGATANITAAHDLWVPIGANQLTAAAVTGKTEGTDFMVDKVAGLFMALSTGSINDGDPVTVIYDCPAREGKEIVAGTIATLNVQLIYNGINLYNNHAIELDVYHANITASGALNFVSNTPLSVTFKGTCSIPTGKTGPYKYIDHNAP